MRFKEFKGEWERTTIGEYGTVVTGKTPSTTHPEYYGGHRLWASPADLGINKMVSHTTKTLTDKGFSKTRSLSEGSVLATCVGSTIGKMGMASCEMSTNQQINAIIVSSDFDKDFVYYNVLTAFPKYLKEVAQNAVPILSKSSFENLPTWVTDFNEQKKIGKFLSLVDDRIATQNAQIEKLKSLIRGIVVHHYRQARLCSPAKISELGEPFSTMALSKEQLSEDGKECIIYGELFTLYGCVVDKVLSHTQVTKGLTMSTGNDLLFPASTTVDALSLIAPSALLKKDVVLGGDMFGIKVSKSFSVKYLSYFFNYIGKEKLAKYAQGSTIIHLHYSDIANASVRLPSLEEQEKVVKAADAIAEKLTVEKALLHHYERQREYLLRNMFV